MSFLKMCMMSSTAQLERHALSDIWHWGSDLAVLMESEGVRVPPMVLCICMCMHFHDILGDIKAGRSVMLTIDYLAHYFCPL